MAAIRTVAPLDTVQAAAIRGGESCDTTPADMLAMFHSVWNIQACRVANTVWQIGDIGIKNKKCAFSLQITILYLGI